jgi:hypothetical protein
MNYEELEKAILVELETQLVFNLIPAKENMTTYNENSKELVEALYAEYQNWV